MVKPLRSAMVMLLLVYLGMAPCFAGGLFGDVLNAVAPGLGTAADDAHREIKKAVPLYGQVEEGASRLVNESSVQASAPILKNLILASRDDALRAGVMPIPQQIRRNLEGYFPNDLLDRVRYRVKGGGDLSLQVSSIRYGEAQAITLDYVVVFANENDALFNPGLWAHEMQHVRQFKDWGVDDFAKRYLRNHRTVESDAEKVASDYVAWAAKQVATVQQKNPNFNRPVKLMQDVNYYPSSNICSTPTKTCSTPGVVPAGANCWCEDEKQLQIGSTVPQTPNLITDALQGTVGTSSTCRFTKGPRAGQTQSYLGLVLPIPIGSSCHDGQGSNGVAVDDSKAQESGGGTPSVTKISSTCRFTQGPRAGQIQSYKGLVPPIPVGSTCQDGASSWGTAIAEDQVTSGPSTTVSQPALSSTCKFIGGPRAGETQSFAGQVQPIPVGSPCHDGSGSYGNAVPDGSSGQSGTRGQGGTGGMSTTCQYTSGPRAGETESYAGRVQPIPVGSPCHDGRGSTGHAIPD